VTVTLTFGVRPVAALSLQFWSEVNSFVFAVWRLDIICHTLALALYFAYVWQDKRSEEVCLYVNYSYHAGHL